MNDSIKMLVYGNSGSGKTTFLATANEDERTSPVLWLDLEGGASSFKSRRRVLESVKDIGDPQEGFIDVLRLKTWQDISDVYEYLYAARHVNKIVKYKTVVLDSLTEINDFALKMVMNNSNAQRLDIDVPEQRDYLKTNGLMKKLLRGLRDIEDLHVFMTALPKEVQDSTEGIVQIQPDLIGKLSQQAMAMYDFGLFLRVNTTKKCRELLFEPKGKIVAKKRDEKMIFTQSLYNPTMARFLDVYEEKTTLEKQNA